MANTAVEAIAGQKLASQPTAEAKYNGDI